MLACGPFLPIADDGHGAAGQPGNAVGRLSSADPAMSRFNALLAVGVMAYMGFEIATLEPMTVGTPTLLSSSLVFFPSANNLSTSAAPRGVRRGRRCSKSPPAQRTGGGAAQGVPHGLYTGTSQKKVQGLDVSFTFGDEEAGWGGACPSARSAKTTMPTRGSSTTASRLCRLPARSRARGAAPASCR